MRLRIVIGQLEVDWEPSVNLRRITSFLHAEASPGSLVILPEAALSGYDDELSGLADLDQRALAAAMAVVARSATDRDLHVLCGSLLAEGDQLYNAALYFGPGGERWVYRKVNLATHERGRLVAGSVLPLLDLPPRPHSPAACLGVQLCRELKFPEQWHVLARRGAQVLAYPTYAANPQIASGVWRSHLISRAGETQRFVLAANVAHPYQHCPSMVVSPRGEILAEAPTTAPQSLHAELDLAEVSDWLLSQQRGDVVAVSYPGLPAG